MLPAGPGWNYPSTRALQFNLKVGPGWWMDGQYFSI